MIRCLCCDREIVNPAEYESSVRWHKRCIKVFWGTDVIPDIDCSEEELERLANLTVNQGLTVPGVQKKLSLHLDTSDRTPKLTIVDHPTGYILKPQSKEYDCLPEAEFLSMKMAEVVRIQTVPNALIRIGEEYTYITKRVDRDSGKMFAMEDFCQLSGRMTEDKYRSSYENCGRVIKEFSRNIGIDISELYYRLLFCFLTGNSDMHLKNFSLLEDNPGSRVFALSPAYDLLPVNIVLPQDTEEMALTLNGKKRKIKRNDFMAFADNLGLNSKAAGGLIRELLNHIPTLMEHIDRSYVSDTMKDGLKELIEKRADALM